MKSSAQKKVSKMGSTQKFTGIKEIHEDVVVLDGGNAFLIIEVQASNFALLSKQEQDTKIYSYASLLNSLSFPIQIVARNKKIDISNYLNFLDQEAQKAATRFNPNNEAQGLQGEGIASYIKLYREFIEELITVNSVLDKKFYFIISYSYLEKGVTSASNPVKKGGDGFFESAKATLHTKAESLLSQIGRLSLHAKTLQEDELIKLFYDIYNPDQTSSNEIGNSVKAPIIKTQENI